MSEAAIHDYLTKQIIVNHNIVSSPPLLAINRLIFADNVQAAKPRCFNTCQHCKEVCYILFRPKYTLLTRV